MSVGCSDVHKRCIQFAIGAEYRKEKSRSIFSDLELGLLPANSPAGPAGTFIGDISDNNQLIFDPTTRTRNSGGSFDVKEVFGEISVPIVKDVDFFHELTIGAAGRYADYSTVGGAFTWNVNGVWSPIRDIRFRGTYARAIRAPNIAELFDPQQGAVFRPADPCDLVNQDATPQRLPNCIAAATALGIPNAASFLAGYEDPLTGRFSGTSGGNPDLDKEPATTWTVGAVVQPRFIPGLTISGDYYSIKIEDAISVVTSQDIVNTCYDNAQFPNQFCDLFNRNGPAAGPATFGFNFLRQTQLNFGRIETSGVDFNIDYRFTLGGSNNFNIGVAGNWTEKVDRFFDPTDPSLVNPALRELSVPEWSGNANITFNRGAFTFGYNLQYIGSTAAAGAIQIERIDEEFGAAGFGPEYFLHNISFGFDVDARFSFYGGVNNLNNAEPYLSSSAYPVPGLGRFYFLGLRAKI